MENDIIIKPSFIFKDYFKVSLYMLIRKPFIVIVISLITLIFAFNFLVLLTSYDAETTFNNFKPFYIYSILFPSLLVFSIYRATKKSMENPKLKEDIKIHITKEYYEEIGQTFSIKYSWSEIFKITERKDWFLIFIEKNKTKIILKADLKDNQYNELKALFNSLPIKKRLK